MFLEDVGTVGNVRCQLPGRDKWLPKYGTVYRASGVGYKATLGRPTPCLSPSPPPSTIVVAFHLTMELPPSTYNQELPVPRNQGPPLVPMYVDAFHGIP